MSFNQGFFLFIFLMVIIIFCYCCLLSLNCVWFFASPCIAECCAFLSSRISQSLLKFMSIESVMLSSNLIFGCPILFSPSIFLSIRVSSSELALPIRWPNYWSFNISVSPSKQYSVLISFRIYWFHLLAVQGTLENLLQHHNLKASVLQYSAIFMA